MKVSELARQADVHPDTVRYYTREGLLCPDRDPDNGYHHYNDEDLRRLRFARKARQLGFSLSQIGAILGEADEHQSPCPLVRELFEQRLAAVEQELAELTRLRERMRQALSAWQSMPDGSPDGHTICRLIEHWDDAQGGAA
ncbi:DNA-binding transcriptional MerR regulator [Tamilnaduibacter salinus]|uniref:DNA-binding transcriptional MerR regulator n=1 Tax=Tamilnaduibacter salinus TaxID=1484056 RepID=A0A2U1CYM7_9GAMM|nr:MerR family transcriptional regulator [Tamilnaduibacter salinus]PVY77596.1 DNA-binding transcriptional MerR regulator [Tamilnaduibacter salinus]